MRPCLLDQGPAKQVYVHKDAQRRYTASVVEAVEYTHEMIYSRYPATQYARDAAKAAGLKIKQPGAAWLIWLDTEKEKQALDR